ncbi:MAG: DNA polymerase Y family protein [Spongiibacteraceae bacterium]
MECADDIWLCLHFPQLALAVFGERDPEQPAAVIEQRLLHCANRANLEPGLAVSTASALYADLLVLERQPQRETELLQGLAYLAYRFTPAVTVAADNSLLLEVGSCRRLYRGIKPLLEQLQNALHERGHTAIYGLAHTPKAAWLLARPSRLNGHPPALVADQIDVAVLQGQLTALSIACLQIDNNSRIALQQMGIATLGDLLALPVAAIGKRFGGQVVRYLQQLRGESADPQSFFIPAPVFRQGLTFLDGIPQRQMLLFPMKRLLHTLCDYLRARQLFCHVLRWQLFDAHQSQAEIIIKLSRTQNDWQTFLDLSRIKLDQVILRESVFSVSLYSDDFFASAPVSNQLFPDAKDHADAGHALFDRLQARLGKAALQRIEACESLWPERGWQIADTAATFSTKNRSAKIPSAKTLSAKAPASASGGPRPLWLLPQPKLLRERDGQPLLQYTLTLLRGPERVDNHWWDSKNKNNNQQARDYFVARTRDGRLCWLFQETDNRQWFLHGWFA